MSRHRNELELVRSALSTIDVPTVADWSTRETAQEGDVEIVARWVSSGAPMYGVMFVSGLMLRELLASGSIGQKQLAAILSDELTALRLGPA